MAPLSVKDRLPLQVLLRWFLPGPGVEVDSPVFKLHHQATSFVIVLGFMIIAMENYLDTKAIVCHNDSKPYPKLYCWLHGYAYINPDLRDRQTGCYVDQRYITSAENAPVTNYYLWLPYLMSFLFLLTKLPHSLWKKYFENNLMHWILAGREETWNLFKKGNKGGGGDGNDKDGKKKDQQQNQQKSLTIGKPSEVAAQFLQYRSRYAMYQINFAICEAANLIIVLASIQVTHWLLNNKFWSYGLEVISYLHNYQGDHLTGQRLHDPMCEVFPTEVQCTLRYGGDGGFDNVQNILCILGNNLFNQKYFFLLWVWWMFMLMISVFGLVFRIFRILNPYFSKYLFIRKFHGRQFHGVRMSSADSFILETLVDNLARFPTAQFGIMEEIAASLRQAQRRPWMDETLNETFKCEKIPMIKSNQINNTQKPDLCPNIEKAGHGVDEWKGQNAKTLFDQDQKVMPSAAQDSLKRDININVAEEVCVEKGNSKKKKNKKQNKGQNQKMQSMSMCPLVSVADSEDGESLLTKPPSQCDIIQNQDSINQVENRHLGSADGDATVASFPPADFNEKFWL